MQAICCEVTRGKQQEGNKEEEGKDKEAGKKKIS